MIVVLTCPRVPSYAPATLAQIDACTSDRRVLLVDGVVDSVRFGWEVACRPRPVVPPQNKWTAWEAFRLADAAAEDLCFFEDDLEFSTNAPAYIADFEVPPDLAFVTFFSTWLKHEQPLGLWRIHAHSYVMAQALKFPLRTVRELIAVRESPLWDACRLLGGFDEVLRWVAIQKGYRYGIVNPGIVQHIGATSVVGNGDLVSNRVAHNYAGRDFDANALRKFPSGFFS